MNNSEKAFLKNETLENYKVELSLKVTENENNEDLKEILDDMIFNTLNLPEKEEDIERDLLFTIKNIKVEYYKAKQKELSTKIAMSEELENEEEYEKALEELQKISKLRNKVENE